MKRILTTIKRVYALMIRLFPSEFQAEFGEELHIVFSAMVGTAARKGMLALAVACLQEMRDFPVLLVHEHLERRSMQKLFRSQPVQFAVRWAVVFSLSLTLVDVLIYLFSSLLTPLTIQYGGTDWRNMLSPLAGYCLASVAGGLLFALLFGGRTRFGWYALVGIMGWFLSLATTYMLTYSFWSINWDIGHRTVMAEAELILAGGCLGVMFTIAKTNKRNLLWPLAISAILLPSLAYFVPHLLLHSYLFSPLLLDHSPWFFIIMLIMVALFVASIFLFAIKVDGKVPRLAILGLIGYPLVSYAGGWIATFFSRSFHFFLPNPGGGYMEGFPGAFAINAFISNLLIGILFGAVLGLLSGWQGKSASQEKAQ
jgi:hypothetical protein